MVRDGGVTFRQHPQCFGISKVAHSRCQAAFLSRKDPARTGEISELMYADDILILAVRNEDAEIYMQCIEQAGGMYGLQLNWNKLQCFQCDVKHASKNPMKIMSFRRSLYFIWEAFLCHNGSIRPELNRRLGAARAEFETLCRVRNHAAPPKAGKIRIFEPRVLSKLLFCLHTAWLNKAELKRLNFFKQNVSKNISPSRHPFVSRISNKIVLEQSGRQEISSILTYRQVVLVGKIAAPPSADVGRQCEFFGQTLWSRIVEQPQRLGRPEWS